MGGANDGGLYWMVGADPIGLVVTDGVVMPRVNKHNKRAS